MISTRGRYSLRVLIDLAEHFGEGYIPMKEIAKRQGLSLKYLERFVPLLSKSGLIEGVQGKGGGYRLRRKPQEYTIREILHIVEGDLAPVSCLKCGSEPCDRVEQCRTISMWKDLQVMIDGYFEGITLGDLMNSSGEEFKNINI